MLVDDGPPGCLQVQLLDGSWIGVDRPPHSFVCNIGDMLMQSTGGQYRATPHRVIASQEADRISIPFFFEPNFDAVVNPVSLPDGSPTCTSNPDPDQSPEPYDNSTYSNLSPQPDLMVAPHRPGAASPAPYGCHLYSKLSTNFALL
uniref:Isopenicillin N synthase-like Fe(2+) 2OG dioxygenase domain-containing protein n=1 Tax=Eutreptiella gymnastica TaxID=73025 RepID=A0A7S1N596_9EUGL